MSEFATFVWQSPMPMLYQKKVSPTPAGIGETFYWFVIRVGLLYTLLDDVADEIVELLHGGDEYALVG